MTNMNRIAVLATAPPEVREMLVASIIAEGNVKLDQVPCISLPEDFPHRLALDLLVSSGASFMSALRMFSNPETVDYVVRSYPFPGNPDWGRLMHDEKLSLEALTVLYSRSTSTSPSTAFVSGIITRFGMDGYRKIFGDEPFWNLIGAPEVDADVAFSMILDRSVNLYSLNKQRLLLAVDAVAALRDLMETSGVDQAGRDNIETSVQRFVKFAMDLPGARSPLLLKLDATGLKPLELSDLSERGLTEYLTEKLGTNPVAWVTTLDLMASWDYDKGSSNDLIETALGVAAE